MWPFKRKTETRSADTGYTSAIMAARAAYITGATGRAELTAAAQSSVSLWEGGLGLADVTGTDLLTRRSLALSARSLALRGEALFLIGDNKLIPAIDWDLSTRMGEPYAYRLTVPEINGGSYQTVLSGEVLHFRIGSDAVTPWAGTSPLRRSSLSADLLAEVETALFEVYRDSPMGSQIVPVPEGSAEDMEELRTSFRGNRGASLVIEGVAQAVAAGMAPNIGKSPDQLSPDLSKTLADKMLTEGKNAIYTAYGILPAMQSTAAVGTLVREAQRHLAQYTLQPIAEIMAEECAEKLGTAVTLDVMRPLQAFDVSGRARAMSVIIGAMADAKEAGVDPAQAMSLVDWSKADV